MSGVKVTVEGDQLVIDGKKYVVKGAGSAGGPTLSPVPVIPKNSERLPKTAGSVVKIDMPSLHWVGTLVLLKRRGSLPELSWWNVDTKSHLQNTEGTKQYWDAPDTTLEIIFEALP